MCEGANHQASDVASIARISKHRSVGQSSANALSSRSHMLLRLEVVTEELLRAREVYAEAKAVVPALRNAVERVNYSCYQYLVDMRESQHVPQKGWPLRKYSKPGEWARRKADKTVLAALLGVPLGAYSRRRTLPWGAIVAHWRYRRRSRTAVETRSTTFPTNTRATTAATATIAQKRTPRREGVWSKATTSGGVPSIPIVLFF